MSGRCGSCGDDLTRDECPPPGFERLIAAGPVITTWQPPDVQAAHRRAALLERRRAWDLRKARAAKVLERAQRRVPDFLVAAGVLVALAVVVVAAMQLARGL